VSLMIPVGCPVTDKMLHCLSHAGPVDGLALLFILSNELVQLGLCYVIVSHSVLDNCRGKTLVRLEEVFDFVELVCIADGRLD
jgi:hypothetical protein